MIVHPRVIATPDTPSIYIREAADAFDVEAEIVKVLHRQGWGLGTRFNVCLVDHAEKTLLATASYVVTGEAEDYVTNDVDGYATMSKTVFRRKCARLGEWTRFTEKAPVDVDDMTIQQLQKTMKELTGKGFKPGTSVEEMAAAVREAQQGKAA